MPNAIDQDDFDTWLAHPITVKLMHRCDNLQEELRLAWLSASWHVSLDDLAKIPTEKLAYLRGKSDAFRSLSMIKYGDLYKQEKLDEQTRNKTT